jgi:predicted transcriptional regulator
MENKIDFRKILKEKIKSKNISIMELAKRANLNYGTVYYFIKGRSEITAENLATLFNVLGEMK